jgi:hypothetical protein
MGDGPNSEPPILLRLHLPSRSVEALTAIYKDDVIDLPWNGEASLEISTREKVRD